MKDRQKRIVLYTTTTVVAVALGLLWLISALVQQIASKSYTPIVTNDEEAVRVANKFLSAAGISTNKYDMGKPSSITPCHFLAEKHWWVAWSPRTSADGTNDLLVLVSEYGGLHYQKQPNRLAGMAGFAVQGEINNPVEGKIYNLVTNTFY
ncbi:MAG: hypothetical protein HY343_12665 [Lentisphaerae bacterium]|nr:hypothetical protein [Lentisphaerota bacterium]